MRLRFDVIIVLICLISSIARFALDTYLPSLPAISHAFHTSHAQAQLTISLYLLGFSISQIFYGPLSDYYGRKRIIITGLLVFLIGSIISVFAVSMTMLVASRLVSGIGAGATAVLNRAIASDCFKGAEFARAWSYTTTTLTIALILAPLIGGYIQDYFGWRGNLMFISGYVGIAAFILIKYLPETNSLSYSSPINIKSISQLYWQMLKHKQFMAYILCYTLTFSGLIAYFQVSPFLFIDDLGYSASEYGKFSLYIAASYLIGGLLVQRFVRRIGINKMLVIGLVVMAIGGFFMLTGYWVSDLNSFVILIPAVFYVIGSRIVIPNAMAGSLQAFSNKAGCAASIIGFIQMLGSAFISFLLTNFYHDTQLPLALVLIAMALFSSICFVYINSLEKYQSAKVV